MRKHERIISGIMTVCLMGSSFFIPEMPLRASAESYKYESLKYDFDGDGNIKITGCDKSVTGVDIPEEIDGIKVTGIGYYAFANCENLEEIKIPESVTVINTGAFSGCKNLTEITLPESITDIENSTFYGCKSLKEIAVPDGVKNIGGSAFSECTGLEKITLSDSVENIYISAFNGCTALMSIDVPESNTYYSSIDGILFNKDKSEIVRYCTALSDKSYAVPESVKIIGDYSFSGCKNLEEIKIPESVESIGVGAFSECKNITEMTIPESVGNIGDKAFKNCKNLISVNIPECIRNINNEVFFNCVSLEAIELPEGLETIGAKAFQLCQTLKKVDIPENVESIGYYAFYECTGLKTIEIPKSVKFIDNCAFAKCDLSKVTIFSSDCELRPTSIDNMNATKSIKVYGYEDSTAHEYCRSPGYQFFTLSEITGKILGDLNGDNLLGSLDLKILREYILNGTETGIVEWRNADFNGDGVLDIFDYCLMNHKIVKGGW